MPCQSDYLESTPAEKELSKILALLDELDAGKKPDESFGYGYDKRAYGNPDGELNKSTALLCSKLQKVKDITKFSLEMQIWWRDHKKADAKRLKEEIHNKKVRAEKKKAVEKLSQYERKLLGL